MNDFIKFFLLGLGAGGAYSLLALGIVLVYRGSGVVNFAHGALALFGVAVFYELRKPVGSPTAIILGVLGSAILGVVVQMAIMRPMRRSSSLMRVVATLAILSVIQEGATIQYGVNPLFIADFLPSRSLHVSHSIVVGEDRFINLGVTVLLTAILWLLYRHTRFGIATTALAENERATASLGWSPTLLALGNWAAGGALAGLAGILLAPITGLSPEALTLAVVPALAAGLVGGFASFPLTLLGGLLIGVLESETTRYINTPGWSSAVPFLAIILLLVVRGRALPLRSHTFERLPKIGSGRLKLGALLIGMGVASISLVGFSDNWAAAMSAAAVYGFVSLSLVVVVGFCGQLSLAQFAIAGIGAFISTRLAETQDLGFPLAFLIGLVATVLIGVIVALPAVRVRGVNLAVVTLGLAVVVSDVILTNSAYTGGLTGTVVKPASVGGLSVYSVVHPQRWAGVGLVLFVAAGLLVANLRRGRTGRRMIAVRDNERAAASLGVSVMGTKLYAFAVGAGLAAIGGMLLVYAYTNIEFSPFDVLSSVNELLLAVIGSIGYTTGAIVGGLGSAGGPAQQTISHVVTTTGNWYLFVAGLVTIAVLVVNPDGLVSAHANQVAWLRAKLRLKPRRARGWDLEGYRDLGKVVPKTLEVENLGVSFGGVKALDGVSLRIEPGKVVGLIGPNGAGKTTLIDAVAGFVRSYEGSIKLNGAPIDAVPASARARAGLTRSFQSLELFEDLSVADNLRAAADPQDRVALATDLVWPGKPSLGPEAALAVKEFQLEDSLDCRPQELPYAKRRLVAIARAVAARPSVLLLDEPAAGLDARSTLELSGLIRRLADGWGMSILLIEHDVNMVSNTCDQVVVLNFGQRIATGSPEAIRHDPRVIEAYLGTTSSDEMRGAGSETTIAKGAGL